MQQYQIGDGAYTRQEMHAKIKTNQADTQKKKTNNNSLKKIDEDSKYLMFYELFLTDSTLSCSFGGETRPHKHQNMDK